MGLLNACKLLHERDIGVYRCYFGSATDPDFLGLAAILGFKEYVVDVFSKSDWYSPEYKSYLLLCAAHKGYWPTGEHSPNDEYWTEKLELIAYLLSQGCTSKAVIVPFSEPPYKTDVLETLLWNTAFLLSRSSRLPDKRFYDGITETICHFIDCGMGVSRHLYGFLGPGSPSSAGILLAEDGYKALWWDDYAIYDGHLRGKFAGTWTRGDSGDGERILVGWPILGLLSHTTRVRLPQSITLSNQLDNLISCLGKDARVDQSRIIAIGWVHLRLGRTMRE